MNKENLIFFTLRKNRVKRIKELYHKVDSKKASTLDKYELKLLLEKKPDLKLVGKNEYM